MQKNLAWWVVTRRTSKPTELSKLNGGGEGCVGMSTCLEQNCITSRIRCMQENHPENNLYRVGFERLGACGIAKKSSNLATKLYMYVINTRMNMLSSIVFISVLSCQQVKHERFPV